jgi:hypothetical protein
MVTTRSIIRELEPEELKELHQNMKRNYGLTRFARLRNEAELHLIEKNFFELTGKQIEE